MEQNQTQKARADAYPFRFTVLSAVYRAEDYLDEFIGSILSQSIGFEENVQLVLVDDGSPDRSGEICDRYQKQYPNNVVVVHKENGGVSAARNAGLPHAKGAYVNFCDPDDMLTPDTLRAVNDFFEAHGEGADIVSIPITMFGDVQGAHILNQKFSAGTRLIPLQKEWTCLQLSAASAFFRAEVAARMHFNPALVIAEDAEQIARILIEKPYLGVVTEGEYLYRRHVTSALGTATQKKEWYNASLKHFSVEILELAQQKYGYVPRFIQNMIAYDLQWKLPNKDYPNVLTPAETEEYMALAVRCIRAVDEDVWASQKHMAADLKLRVAQIIGGDAGLVTVGSEDIYYGNDYHAYQRFSKAPTELCFLEVGKETVTLSIRQTVLAAGPAPEQFWLRVGGERVCAGEISSVPLRTCLGETVSFHFLCAFEIPRRLLSGACTTVEFHTVAAGIDILQQNVVTGPLFPVTRRFASAYFARNGLLFLLREQSLVILKADRKTRKRCEKAYREELWKSDAFGARKAVIARAMLSLFRTFCKKEIWILSDRVNKAGDNGEAMFRHLKNIRYKGAKFYYAVSKGASYEKLKPLGNVIEHGSKKYKLLFMACDKIISAHADDVVLNPFDYYSTLYQDILRGKDFIFLQHGIIQSDLSGWLNRYNKNIRGFATSVRPEYDSIVNGPYFYTPKQVWLTGLARFDRLYHDEKKCITVMPTWRRYLMSRMDRETGVWMENDNFRTSEYFRFYNSLINHPRLLAAAKEYGYTLCYMPHPNTITKIDQFDRAEGVRFFSVDDEYRDVYAQSNLVLTDYSSAAFDFAYLRKPVLYAQFDRDEFFGGSHVGTFGYFHYERDGFGEVTYDLESTVDMLIDYMKNDCALKEKYRARIDSFFAFDDRENCRRILEKIEELE